MLKMRLKVNFKAAVGPLSPAGQANVHLVLSVTPQGLVAKVNKIQFLDNLAYNLAGDYIGRMLSRQLTQAINQAILDVPARSPQIQSLTIESIENDEG
jgi:hypothetical protein